MTMDEVDPGRRRFLTATTSVVGAVGVACAAVPFVSSWQPSARARAIGAPIRVDISKIEPAQRLTVKWRGKPIWVLRRTREQLATLGGHEAELRDPNSEVATQQPAYAQNQYRSIREEYLVLIGICTHLGCVPLYVRRQDPGAPVADWPGGFFCPCHGSRFDLAGRVFAGVPAPTNLEVPPYHYVSDQVIEVGVDKGAA